MPMSVTPQSQDASGSSYNIQSRTSNESRTDDSGSGGRSITQYPAERVPAGLAMVRLLTDFIAESRTRKRFQKSTSDGTTAAKNLASSITSTKGIAEPRSNFTSKRRQSIRDPKAPLGPRPPDFTLSKRYVQVHQRIS